MSKYKDMAKNRISEGSGHHIRDRVGGRVNGVLGRKKEDPHERAANHVSVPIDRLRDPSSFAAPPKRTGTGLVPPPPPSSSKRKVIQAPSKWQDPRGPPVDAPERQAVDPELDEYYSRNKQGQLLLEGPGQEEEETTPREYRVNTTGLSTNHLPKPPGRRDNADGRSPPPYEEEPPQQPPRSAGPPKLPSRMGVRSPPAPSTPSRDNGGLNQGAMSRLAGAGVSVPSLGIGSNKTGGSTSSNGSAPPPMPPRHPSTQSEPPPMPPRQPSNLSQAPSMPSRQPSTQSQVPASHLSALQTRLSKMTTQDDNAAAAAAPAPSEGTSWQQKQAALKTASQFQKDPASVSFTDVKSAASTANNFRQRHGEQAAAGWNKANQLNDRYGVAGKVGGLAGNSNTGNTSNNNTPVAGVQSQSPAGNVAATALASVAAKKKPPPPPPKKKPAALASVAVVGSAGDGPPPIPLSTRPQF